MRHRKLKTSLNRTKSHRKATVKNMLRAILTSERIVTTVKKAKVMSRWTDKIITLSKKNNLAAIRRVESILQDKDLIYKLFHEIGPRFADRNGGYTRVIKYKKRRGDGSELAILELTEREVMSIEETERKKKTESKTSEPEAKVENKAVETLPAQAEEAVVEVEAEAEIKEAVEAEANDSDEAKTVSEETEEEKK